MENASKALIIAGSVLVALLIVSLGVALYRNASEGLESSSRLDKERVSTLNESILEYLGDNVSGTNVNALISLVRSRNNECVRNEDFTTAITISCTYKENGSDETKSLEIKDGQISGELNRVPTGSSHYYKVKEEYNDGKGRTY